MFQYLSWAANTALFVGCSFLSANIANSIFAAALTPTPTRISESAGPTAAAKRDWEDREVILSRNLFKSSTLARPVPEIVAEELEATKLPLTLLGTASATDDLYSWAAIKDRDSTKTKILRVGDEVRPTAIVMRIERRRVVLDENGLPRELVLKETEAAAPRSARPAPKATAHTRKRPSRSRRAPAPAVPKRLPNLQKGRLEIPRGEFDATLIDPGDLLNQARFTPKFEEGQMVGLQIHDPKSGSLFERAGIGSGDVITEINGVAINSAEQSRNVLSSFEGSDEVEIVVLQDGESVTKTLSISNP